jgi:hypothetical protein
LGADFVLILQKKAKKVKNIQETASSFAVSVDLLYWSQ